MNAALMKICLLAGLALWVPAAFAQDDEREAEMRAEQERQEIFRAGFQDIVADLNNNSFERFAHAIDREDMPELTLDAEGGTLGIAHLLKGAGLVSSTS